jgi:hypothetical protein
MSSKVLLLASMSAMRSAKDFLNRLGGDGSDFPSMESLVAKFDEAVGNFVNSLFFLLPSASSLP